MSQSLDASTLSHSQSEKYPEIQPVVPMNRVKTIMKSSPEVSAINTETLYVVCKATVCSLEFWLTHFITSKLICFDHFLK